MIVVPLADGREIATPINFFPSLAQATLKQRGAWKMVGWGEAFYWPELDLDVSVEGMIAGHHEHIPPPGWYENRNEALIAMGLPPLPIPAHRRLRATRPRK